MNVHERPVSDSVTRTTVSMSPKLLAEILLERGVKLAGNPLDSVRVRLLGVSFGPAEIVVEIDEVKGGEQ